jgi:uncharacterized phage protein (predicted DNA packaging)
MEDECMITTLEEAKMYLRIDHSDEDALITDLINTSENLCKDIIRLEFSELENIPETLKTAVLYGVTYLYENREKAEYKELISTLSYLLFGIRREIF